MHRVAAAAAGVLPRRARTAEAFRGGWFHSGDLAVVDEDGFITLVDRKKDMIKTGGENVATREVEDGTVPAPGGGGGGRPRSATPEMGRGGDSRCRTTRGADRQRGSGHRSLPGTSRWLQNSEVVVSSTDLPKNPSGKILKRDLRITYAHLAD